MRRLFGIACVVVLAFGSGLTAAAQTPPRPPQATTPPPQVKTPPPAKPEPSAPLLPPAPPMAQTPGRGVPPSPKNIKLDITISDTASADGPTKKSVTLLLLSGRNGQVRSTGIRGIINVDAMPSDIGDNRIAVNLTIEYQPELSGDQAGGPIGKLTESLTVALESGKPTVITQSADPRTDRKVSVEVTATIVK